MGKLKYLWAALVVAAMVAYQKNADHTVEPETMPDDVCWGTDSGQAKNGKHVRPFQINISTEVSRETPYYYLV